MDKAREVAERLLDRLELPHAGWRIEACEELLAAYAASERSRLADEAERIIFVMPHNKTPGQVFAAWLREQAEEFRLPFGATGC